MDIINKLQSIPMHEQRSDAWFKQRKNKLTSSDAGTVLGLNPYQKPKEVLFKKCGYDPKPFVGNIATRHGQKYEDEAIEKYTKLTGQKNYDFGLLAHEDVHNSTDYPWLAGSPDGISMSLTDPDAKPILLEVKCPYKRKIVPGKIPEYYYPQVQLNMFICGLEVSDFIEYFPPTTMSIVRTYINHNWLKINLPILAGFWEGIVHYRMVGIEIHPDFPKKKNVIDFRTQDTILDEDSQTIILGNYSIIE